MAKNTNRNEKKVVSPTTRRTATPTAAAPTASRTVRKSTATEADMIFGKQNYMLMGVGLVLVVLGFLLMSGGAQEADTWKAGEIYSFRRTVLAPIVILAGLIVEIFAIFKR
jgi:hypothetical protein